MLSAFCNDMRYLLTLMKYKQQFNQQPTLRFRQFTRKRWALFACLGRVVTISVLSVATLKSASAATDDVTTKVEYSDDDQSTDKEVKLHDLEVTGSLAPLATGQAARMVTVLSREDIQAAPVQSINDLLKLAVGVDVRQRGPIGAQTDVGIRGGTQEQITILLNGINICDPQTAHNTLDLPCDISDIIRIEVLEGPAGRAYGTSSMLGAINIVTKPLLMPLTRKGKQAHLRLEGGSFGYLSTAGRYALRTEDSPVVSAVSACYTRSDGYQRSLANRLNSDYEGGKVFYQGGYDNEKAQVSWHAGMSTKGFGSNTFYSAKFDEQYERTAKLFTALQGDIRCKTYEVRGKTYEAHLKPAIYWNRSYDRFELTRGSEAKVPYNYHCTDVVGVNMNGWLDWQMGRTAFGAECRNENIISTTLGELLDKPRHIDGTKGEYKYGLNRTNISLNVEHNILLRSFTLSAGFIAVKNTWNKMPIKIYPGIDASYRMGDHWRVYASYNSSLRMPSFTELYYSVGGHKADKFLKPEELQAVEGGMKYSARRISVQASAFYNHCRNIIDWVMDTRETDPVWQSVNHTTVNTWGQEISINTKLSARLWHLTSSRTLNFQFAYCHLHQQKPELPYLQSQYSLEYLRHKLTAAVTVPIASRLSLVVKYRFQDRIGSYTDTGGEVRQYRPYSIVDSRLSWEDERCTLYVEGNNLLDTHYVDYGNVTQPGCWVIAGVKYSW